MRCPAKEPSLQVVVRIDLMCGSRNVADDVAGSGSAGTVEEGIAKAFGTLADRPVHLAVFIASRIGGHQA
jgi:hypothetical protein